MDLRTSLPYLYPSDQSSSAKLQSEAPRRCTFDQHPSTIGPLTFAAKNSTLESNNFQRSSQSNSNMTTPPGNKTAEQTSRVASWIRLGQGSQFPSPSSTSSCSSSVSSPTYTQTSVLPLHLLKIPESAKAIASPRRSTLATAPIRKPPVNPPELKLMLPAASESCLLSFPRKPVVIDLTEDDDTPEASEASDTETPSPVSSTLRSCSPSSSQATAATSATTSATTISPSPRTSSAPAESLYEDLDTTGAFQVPPSTSTPRFTKKRGRPFKRRRKKASDSNFTVSPRSNMQATIESSTSYTPDCSDQEQIGDEPHKTFVPEDNNDNCESCRGLGRFICCESCPKAFHFSCCQPPVDPENLPEEWHCTECSFKANPFKPSPPGLFQLLLDNINRRDPVVFELPHEIRSYFRGVETKSDGGYTDTVDHKTFEPATTNQSAWEDALELKDKKDEIRLCYQCGMSALRERWLISCEHCPLHWHLDCLSPPLSSPPTRARKWMCPNHAYHVQPRYRKRRNASQVEVLDPLIPNDGDIEVADEKQDYNNNDNNNNNRQSPDAPEYRTSESNIRFDFIAACSK
ncbi:hypothetical protein F5H01DRAFT_396105 [Linnemannia elongata]|nr:hypothetical protein F5H01DRAFT_396105 [Linnemannia elongata]